MVRGKLGPIAQPVRNIYKATFLLSITVINERASKKINLAICWRGQVYIPVLELLWCPLFICTLVHPALSQETPGREMENPPVALIDFATAPHSRQKHLLVLCLQGSRVNLRDYDSKHTSVTSSSMGLIFVSTSPTWWWWLVTCVLPAICF